MRIVYNKLVRDKMIDIYKLDSESGRITNYAVQYVEKEEILERLKDKLLEEAKEVFEVYDKDDKTELKEEMADVIEVIDAILYHNGSTLEEVLALRSAKKEKRGGFETGLFLESIDYIEGKEPK
jgi:predicted house-cleaning noncanonical NTP pyrophosphatase (MazG superfamily)